MRALAFLVFFGAGCALLQPPENATAEKRLTVERIRDAHRLTLEYGSGSLGNSYSERWILERDGPCVGETENSGGLGAQRAATKEKFELPPTTFREAQRVLLESKFRTLRPGLHGFMFEGSAWLSVDCDGVKHAVSWDQSKILEGDPLLTFVLALRQRAKFVPPPKETP